MKTSATWKLKDAREHLDEVIDEALAHGPQTIVVDGHKAVVVTSAARPQPRRHLLDVLRDAPLEGEDLVVDRVEISVREIDLDR